jgi:hypothetical protein
MHARNLFVASFMVSAIGASMTSLSRADENSPAVSRADVKAAVLSARATGTLRPAGEAAEYDVAPPRGSQRSRAELHAEVLGARAAGELVPAGEAVTPFAEPGVSTLVRADVKTEVRLARLQGELIPSGQGFGPVETVAKAPRHQMFSVVASGR